MKTKMQQQKKNVFWVDNTKNNCFGEGHKCNNNNKSIQQVQQINKKKFRQNTHLSVAKEKSNRTNALFQVFISEKYNSQWAQGPNRGKWKRSKTVFSYEALASRTHRQQS